MHKTPWTIKSADSDGTNFWVEVYDADNVNIFLQPIARFLAEQIVSAVNDKADHYCASCGDCKWITLRDLPSPPLDT